MADDTQLTPEEEARYQELVAARDRQAAASDTGLTPEEETRYQELKAAQARAGQKSSVEGLSMSMQTPAQAAAATPSNALTDPTAIAASAAPPAAPATADAGTIPDITSAVSSALMPQADQHLPYDPKGVIDKYRDMGDFMLMPSLRKEFDSPMAALGLIGSDVDSFEKIIKKNYPKIEVRKEKDGSLVMKDPDDPDPKRRYVFEKDSIQKGDAIRALMGAGVATGVGATGGLALGAGSLLAPAAVAALPELSAGTVGTGAAMLNQYLLSKFREHAGGSPVSPWEVAGAGLIHFGLGKAHQWWRGPEPGPQTAEQLAENVVAGSRGEKAAANAALSQMQPNPNVVAAGGRLGIADSLTPGQVSDNPIFKRMTQSALGDGPTGADLTHTEALRQAANSFERGIQEGGGPGSQDAMERIRKNITEGVGASRDNVNHLYKPETIGVPKAAPIEVANLTAKLDELASDYPKEVNAIRARLGSPEKPTDWDSLDRLTKDLGAASKEKPAGPYKNLKASGAANALREAAKADQQIGANGISPGAGARFTEAQEAFKAHGALKSAYRQILANDAAGSLAGKVVPAIGLLGNGVPEAFDKIMTITPEKDRPFVALAGMYQFIKELATGDSIMDAKKYVNFMKGLERNDLSRKALETHLPEKFVQVMKDVYEVTKAVLETSRIPKAPFEHEFPDKLPLTERLKAVATAIPKAVGFVAAKLPQTFGFDVGGDLFGKPDPLQPLVRKLLTSPLAKEVMRRQVAGIPISDGLVRNFMNSTPARAFMATAPQLKNAPFAQRFDYMRNALGNTKFLEGQQQEASK